MFVKGNKYSTRQISNRFGGCPQHSMPQVSGVVPYCKFREDLNPDLTTKNQVWIECGPMLEKSVNIVVRQDKTHVFKKIKDGWWEYLGKFKMKKINSANKIKTINKVPPRKKVAFILELQ